jgi:hypothetical protein
VAGELVVSALGFHAAVLPGDGMGSLSCQGGMMDLTKPETEMVEINMNDRLGRKIALVLNNDQRCVVGAWISEPGDTAKFDRTIQNTELYERLCQ